MSVRGNTSGSKASNHVNGGGVSASEPQQQSRRVLPGATRSSLHFCRERLACRVRTRAQYRCDQCATYQCLECCELIHEVAKFSRHRRSRIEPEDPTLLCQGPCEDRNFSDVRCLTCERNYCYACDRFCHRSIKAGGLSSKPAKKHLKTLFEDYRKQQLCENGDSSGEIEREQLEEFLSLNEEPGTEEEEEEESEGNSEEGEEERYLSIDQFSSSPNQPSKGMIHMKSLPPQNPPDIICDGLHDDSYRSFLLVDRDEVLHVTSAEDLASRLQCNVNEDVKVVSIFGNTGDGKSHTFNHTLFGGTDVFNTSNRQASCTVGVWAAYHPALKIVVIDTEGLLGMTENQEKLNRLLLKVLAISDVVIYRIRADRLHTDLFNFLGDASKAYTQHFKMELEATIKRFDINLPISALGPHVIVFQETQHTECLQIEGGLTPEEQLVIRFQQLGKNTDAFSGVQYVGIRTVKPPTNFRPLYEAIKTAVERKDVRSQRPLSVLYNVLKALNDKFNGAIDKTGSSTFPDQYFTCNAVCLSCDARCMLTMNHPIGGKRTDHAAAPNAICRFQNQYDNKILLCKRCLENGKRSEVTMQTSANTDNAWSGTFKFLWSGSVIECPACGEIYRTRQYWYGNNAPWTSVVTTEIVHVFPGCQSQQTNTGQKVLDSVQMLTETVSCVTAPPTKILSSWISDRVRPNYWVSNYMLTHCFKCRKEFGDSIAKHHCRACGNGFCDDCSSKQRPVPERGWGDDSVRVCDHCYNERKDDGDDEDVTARKVTEAIQYTLGAVVNTALDFPIGLIKDSARPVYWVPDSECLNCFICQEPFVAGKNPIHHCRGCGLGVCSECSPERRAVPSRGWEHPVRVCQKCFKRSDL